MKCQRDILLILKEYLNISRMSSEHFYLQLSTISYSVIQYGKVQMRSELSQRLN